MGCRGCDCHPGNCLLCRRCASPSPLALHAAPPLPVVQLASGSASLFTPPAGAKFRPQVFVVSFDLPQHVIPAAHQPPPTLPTLYRLLSVGDRRLAPPILNNLVDQLHIGGWVADSK